MAKSTKNRPVLSDKLDNNSITDISAEDITVTETETIGGGKEAPTPSLEESPLLNTGRIELEHAKPFGSAGQEQPAPETSIPSNEGGGYSYSPESQNVNVNFDQPVPENVPASSTSIPGDGPSTLEFPDEASKAASNDLADFILDAYERFTPELGYTFSKINDKEIKKLENEGHILPGAYDEVKLFNKSNKTLLEEKGKADAKYLKKHLRKVLQVKQMNASPEVLLAIAILIVVVGQFVLIMTIRKESKDLEEKILAKIRTNGAVQDAIVHEPKVETVEV